MKMENGAKKPRATSRKSVVKAIVKNDKENRTTSLLDTSDIQEAIRFKAYELYLERGCAPGGDVEDWLMAERLILQGCQ